MSCRIRNLSYLLFVCEATILQIFSSYLNVVYLSGSTTEKDVNSADSPSSIPAILSGRSQDRIASANRLDMLYPDGMLFDASRATTFKNTSVRRRARHTLRQSDVLWPNGEVPYIVDKGTTQHLEELLNQSFEVFHSYSCIRFRPKRADDTDYVKIVTEGACWSYWGRQGGMQLLTLMPSCYAKPFIIRFLGRLIGFIYQHNRPDRDDYVTIRFENMIPESLTFFQKLSYREVDSYGIPFDYLSIMHYGQYAASSQGGKTIETKNSCYQTLIGTSTVFSFRDAKMANKMYRCSEISECKNISCHGEGFVGMDCRCWCPSDRNDTAAEHCEEVNKCQNATCHEDGLFHQDFRCLCPARNRNNTSVQCEEVKGCSNMACPVEELVSQDFRCRCPSENSTNTSEPCAAVKGCTNMTCPEEGLAGQHCRCRCPSGNTNNTSEPCAEIGECDNLTCPGEGFVGKDCRCRCPSGNGNNSSEPFREQVEAKWSVGIVAAVAVGCMVTLSVIATLFLCMVHRRRQRRPKISTPQLHTAPNEVTETSVVSTDYCSLHHQPTVPTYTVLNTEEPVYNTLQPYAASENYIELILYDEILH